MIRYDTSAAARDGLAGALEPSGLGMSNDPSGRACLDPVQEVGTARPVRVVADTMPSPGSRLARQWIAAHGTGITQGIHRGKGLFSASLFGVMQQWEAVVLRPTASRSGKKCRVRTSSGRTGGIQNGKKDIRGRARWLSRQTRDPGTGPTHKAGAWSRPQFADRGKEKCRCVLRSGSSSC
jgi:hypothetical protein